MWDRSSSVNEQFLARVAQADFPEPHSATNPDTANLDKRTTLDLFDSQIKSRLLDLMARQLKEKGLAFYTIGSSGHEGNAVLGHVFRKTDMAFLHYRSGAFYLQRAKQIPGMDGIKDLLSSLVASASDPISGGRHKVFGSLPLYIPPQTSTIASHLPKALGAALSIIRAKELNIASKLPADAVILCSFGDASTNHATAQTTLNACSWLAQQNYPLPMIFICEDNEIGISVPTPKGWIKASNSKRPGIHYLSCDGLNIADVFLKAKQAEYLARTKKQPVFLHMKCLRLLGHAGSDIESQYNSESEIKAREAQDPLLHTARIIYDQGWMKLQELIDLYEDNTSLIHAKAIEAVREPKLNSAQEVMASLLPKIEKKTPYPLPDNHKRAQFFSDSFNQLDQKRNLCQHINFALTDLMMQYPNMLIFGEDVGKKGGVYRVTADLQARFGQRRVFDTLLDETTILGTAIGLAHNGFIPVPEIQFLAYLHNAEDQLRGEASTLSFFSKGQFQNPMLLRLPSFAYQKGFGGHFHNDNSFAVLRDLPGVLVACPSNGPDAARMLRTCLKLAYQEGRIVVFMEPIALYMTKDLHQSGDNQWLFKYPNPKEEIALNEVGVFGNGDTVIITYGNGYYLSLQAAKKVEEQYGLRVKIIDLRWLSPLPKDAILKNIKQAKHILIVDETRASGSLSEGLMAFLMEEGPENVKIKRITAKDCFIPLGTAWQYILPSQEDIINALLLLQSE